MSDSPPTPPPSSEPLDYSAPPASAGVAFGWQLLAASVLSVIALGATFIAIVLTNGAGAALLLFPALAIIGITVAAVRGGARSAAAAVLGLVLTFGGLIILVLSICALA